MRSWSVCQSVCAIPNPKLRMEGHGDFRRIFCMVCLVIYQFMIKYASDLSIL